MILFSNVSSKLDNDIFLENISFKINRNEFVFIYDKNRKSLTALRRLLSGSEKPQEGLIRVMNKYQPSSEILNTELGTVYRENILLPDRSIRQNYDFILGFMGRKRQYNEIRNKKVFAIVGLNKCSNLLPADLLPHQLVRANIGQSLLIHPSVVIFDDATAGLDEVNSQAIFHLMEKVNRLGITIIFLSSDRKMISRNKNKRVIYLKEGKILAEKNKGHLG